MREYAKVSQTFWTGKTGKELKARGPEAVIVSLYLMTCPNSNMLGLYWIPKLYLEHETGLGTEGASKGLARAIEAGFCRYDEASEVVWVMEMAAYQIATALKPADNRCAGIQREYEALPENPFLTEFYERYKDAFCMSSCRGKPKALRRGSVAPPKPRAGAGAGARGEGLGSPGASRLPNDWDPGESGMAFASKQGLTNGKAISELEKFRDHWIAADGANAKKRDWNAAWRTWVRRSIEFASNSRHPPLLDPFEGAH